MNKQDHAPDPLHSRAMHHVLYHAKNSRTSAVTRAAMPQPDLTNASEAIHVWKELKAGRQLTRSVSPPLLSAYVSGTCHVSMCVSVSCSVSFLSQISLSDFLGSVRGQLSAVLVGERSSGSGFVFSPLLFQSVLLVRFPKDTGANNTEAANLHRLGCHGNVQISSGNPDKLGRNTGDVRVAHPRKARHMWVPPTAKMTNEAVSSCATNPSHPQLTMGYTERDRRATRETERAYRSRNSGEAVVDEEQDAVSRLGVPNPEPILSRQTGQGRGKAAGSEREGDRPEGDRRTEGGRSTARENGRSCTDALLLAPRTRMRLIRGEIISSSK